MNNYWIYWYGCGVGFTLHTPWWITGERADGAPTICAAVKAESEDQAKDIIVKAHDKPVDLEWRFCESRPNDWSPFGDRFPRGDWMEWPACDRKWVRLPRLDITKDKWRKCRNMINKRNILARKSKRYDDSCSQYIIGFGKWDVDVFGHKCVWLTLEHNPNLIRRFQTEIDDIHLFVSDDDITAIKSIK